MQESERVSILPSLDCRGRPGKAIHCQRRTQQTSGPIHHKKDKLLFFNQRGTTPPPHERYRTKQRLVVLEIPSNYQYMALCVSQVM